MIPTSFRAAAGEDTGLAVGVYNPVPVYAILKAHTSDLSGMSLYQ
ncbi:hypothetical protein GCM10023188_17470 [Pontibacter saemangeumensis]|uniref:Uncharacterized protein n=1 Tax=Pontibacter saemangeumensis TaxID=1084525 RepID=A0ABP8LLK6_9BACT